VIVLSFPHNPTTACVDLDFFQKVVDFAREKNVLIVHDNAYAELGSTATSRRASCRPRGPRSARSSCTP
jgi:aspartate/methionine/tyrosine aminotransferase